MHWCTWVTVDLDGVLHSYFEQRWKGFRVEQPSKSWGMYAQV